jgi:hypothetical protein
VLPHLLTQFDWLHAPLPPRAIYFNFLPHVLFALGGKQMDELSERLEDVSEHVTILGRDQGALNRICDAAVCDPGTLVNKYCHIRYPRWDELL